MRPEQGVMVLLLQTAGFVQSRVHVVTPALASHTSGRHTWRGRLDGLHRSGRPLPSDPVDPYDRSVNS